MTSTRAHDLAGRPLLRALAENWWLILLRGIAALIFGILAFVWPGITVASLVLLWGAYAIADGIFALWAAMAGKGAGAGPRWWLAIVGILGIVAGLIAFVCRPSRRRYCCSSSPPGRSSPASWRSSARSRCARRSRTNGG